jgi:hypothetical protein
MKFCELDASVEASEPHDFAVRLSAVRQQHLGVHRIPPHVDDVRNAPLGGTRRRASRVDLGKPGSRIFLPPGLDS